MDGLHKTCFAHCSAAQKGYLLPSQAHTKKALFGEKVLHEVCLHILVLPKSIRIRLTFYCHFNINAQILSVVTAVSCDQKQQTAWLFMTRESFVLRVPERLKAFLKCQSMLRGTEIFCPMFEGCMWSNKYQVDGQIIMLIFLVNKEAISHRP